MKADQQVGRSGTFGQQGSHNNESVKKVGMELLGQLKIVKFCQNCKILSKLCNSVKIVQFCQNCAILSKL